MVQKGKENHFFYFVFIIIHCFNKFNIIISSVQVAEIEVSYRPESTKVSCIAYESEIITGECF